MNLSAIPIDSSDLSPQGMLVMVAGEVDCFVEHGFKPKQYIVRKALDSPIFNAKSLYCAARTNGDVITLIGADYQEVKCAVIHPKFFEVLQNALNDDAFMMPTSRDLDTPVCDDRVSW